MSPYVDREVLILTQNGVWMADGSEITHEPTRKLFARSLKHDENGWFLHIGHETKRIIVEDTAFFIQRLDGSPRAGFSLSVSDGSRQALAPSTLRYRPGRLSCLIHGQFEAKFLSAPYAELMSHLEEDEQGYFLSIQSETLYLALK
jgi:hypothetical protein